MPYYETKEEILKLGEIDLEFENYLKENPPVPPILEINGYKEAAKQRLPLLLKILGPAPPGVRVTEISYKTRDNHTNRAKLFQPTSTPENGSPLVILIHGGGFCVGDPESEEQTARNMVRALGTTCVSVGYRLAPEYPFPYAINDCWDAVRYFASVAIELGADPTKGFILGGTSAGGQLSAALAHKARDENLHPPLTGQWLAIPGVCIRSKLPEKYAKYSYSYKQNEFAPVLPTKLIDVFMSAYRPDEDDFVNHSCLNHPKGHQGLAPAYFQVDGLDPLRDDGLIYERVLREEAGVKTRLDVYPGLPHAHWSFFPSLASSKKFRADQIEGFAWLLGRQPNLEHVSLVAAPAIT